MHCALHMHQKPVCAPLSDSCHTQVCDCTALCCIQACYENSHSPRLTTRRSLRTVQRPTSLLTRRHRPHLLLLRRRVNLQNAEAERAGRGGGRETEVEGESEYEKEGDADNKEITEATERGIKRHAAAQRERALAPHR